jgi:hypothetical protein
MPRDFGQVRQAMLERARERRNPFEAADPAAVAAALASLESVEPEAWVAAFGALAEPHMAETLAHAFGGESYADWVRLAPRLSLLDQGVLEQPSAPLLLVNGVHDSVFPIRDMHLLLEHGSAKSARFYADAGHMGGPDAAGVIQSWLAHHLSA